MIDISSDSAQTQRAMSTRQMEWSGCALALAGVFLLALPNAGAGYAFALFLASNVFWLAVSLRRGSLPMLLMQVGFTVAGTFGWWAWLHAAT